MCGIFGVIGRYEPNIAQYCLKKLTHRGVDGFDFYEESGLFFGQTRLAIMDVDMPGGVYQKGAARVVFNGEIYNYKALAKELCIKPPFSEGEVLLSGLCAFGASFLSKLRGMFAIAFWDGQKLLLARDSIGKKPLFYAHIGRSFAFASEIKSILPLLKTKKISKEGLNGFFGFLSPLPPFTIYENVFRLHAGEALLFEEGDVSRYRFDSPLCAVSSETKEESFVKTRELLIESTALRLNADVEVGALLSSGLDSSLVLAISSKILGKKLRTFTVGYDGFDGYDEREKARESADIYGSLHTEFCYSKTDFFDSLDRFLGYMDEPLSDPAALPLDFLIRNIRGQGVKALISGEGSDELFYGYRKYVEYAKFESVAHIPHKNWLNNYFKANVAYNKEWEWFLRAFANERVYRGYGENFLDSQRERLLKELFFASKPLLAFVEKEFEEGGGGDFWRWASVVDLRTWLNEALLHKVDRVSMANGVEVRAPFLDREFVAHSLSVPSAYKFPSSPKSYLKEAFSDILAPSIAQREKKGFSYPYMEWLREGGELEVVRRLAKKEGILDGANIEFYLKARKDKGFKQHLWALFIFSKWYEKNFY